MFSFVLFIFITSPFDTRHRAPPPDTVRGLHMGLDVHNNLLRLIGNGKKRKGGGDGYLYVIPITKRDLTTKTIKRKNGQYGVVSVQK